MTEAVYPEKESFTSTFMYLDHVRSDMLLRFKILYWALEYERVKNEGSSIRYEPSLNWFLIFNMRRESATVVLLTKDCKAVIQGFIAHQVGDDFRRHSAPVPAKVVGDKRYKIEFPSTMICNEENEILKTKGCLVLGFMFDTRRLISTQVGLHVKERDEMSSFVKAYEKRLFTDFIIHANGEEFHIHKAILAARSMYFDGNMHQEQNEVTLNAASKTVQHVIHYLYSGDLQLLTLNELIEVFELGVKLFITSLVDHCILYFLDVMNENNAGRIREAATRIGARTLVEAANQMCSSTL